MYKIDLILLDGSPTGRIKCDLDNWDGLCYRIPRSLIKDSRNIDSLRRTGVYFLFGEKNEKKVIYVGETDNVYDRLIFHFSDSLKDYAREALVFVTKDDKLKKDLARYIEEILIQELKQNKRYKLMNIQKNNENRRTNRNKNEENIIIGTKFINNLKILTGVLGYRAFEKIIDEHRTDADKYKIEKPNKNIKASGLLTNEGFVVLKGSSINPVFSEGATPCFKNSRQKLIDSGVVKNYIFTKDYLFNTPSGAAVVVLGYNVNGLKEWKNENGCALKDRVV